MRTHARFRSIKGEDRVKNRQNWNWMNVKCAGSNSCLVLVSCTLAES